MMKESRDAKESKCIINPNDWEKGSELSFVEVSPDGSWLIYGKDKDGKEDPKLILLDITNSKSKAIELVGWDYRYFVWLENNKGFYYTSCPKGKVEGAIVYKYVISDGTSNKIFYSEESEIFHWASTGGDHSTVFFYKYKNKKREVYYLDHKTHRIMPFITGFDHAYSVYSVGKYFYIHSDEVPNMKVYRTKKEKPERKNWEVVISEKKDFLYDILFAENKLIATYYRKTIPNFDIFDLNGNFLREINLPIGTSSISGNLLKDEMYIFTDTFQYEGLVQKYSILKDSLEIARQPYMSIQGMDIVTEQVEYLSKDGTPISMFLVHKKGWKKNSKNKVLYSGYGGFAVSITPYFSNLYAMWLMNGGVLAVPNLRGGGEYGVDWHLDGIKEKKQNTFDDFIAGAEYLIKENITTSDYLVGYGRSNGGLLMGAMLTQRPDLFKVIVAEDGLYDMTNYHKYGSGKRWLAEYGNPELKSDYEFLKSFSPVENIKKNLKVPATLILCKENDNRVDPFHSRKFAFLLQEVSDDIYFFCISKSGHLSGSRKHKLLIHTFIEKFLN
jgi:prolyl oligopeptidase